MGAARASFSEDDAMEFEQRVPVPEVAATPAREHRLWLADDARVRPRASDSYVVVDERDEGVIVLVVAAWPQLDDLGRLDFRGRRRSVTVTEEALNAVVKRRAKRPEGVDRSVRISDAFSVRGRVTGDPATWGRIVDVTGEAREQARIAYYAAVAPRATPKEAKALRLDEGPPTPPTVEVATVAHPAI
jgi:hypothetical protein